MRKLLSLVLAFAMILGTFAFPVSADQSTYLEVGNELKGLGVISGVNEAGDLAEMEKLTREQALVVLTSLMGQMDAAKATEAEPGFADVPATHWAAKFVAYAKAQGWTSGVSETEFGLGKEVTTKEALSFMMRALGYTADWAKEDIMKKASELGLMEGVSAKAEDQLVRGELFIVMKNTLYTKPMGEKTELVYKLGLKENPVPETLEVVDVKATNLKEVVVEFNQEIDKDTLENAFSSVGLNLANVDVQPQEDGKTVVLKLTDKMKNKQDYKITISKVKSLGGVQMEKVMKEFRTEDNEVPTIEKLEVTGPRTFNMYFSEPIKTKGNVKLMIEKKNGPGASIDFVSGSRIATIVTGTDLKDATTYRVLVSKFEDFAGYKNIDSEVELEYAKVTTAPTVEVVRATQEYVELKFDRPVKGLTDQNFYHTYSAWKPVFEYRNVNDMKTHLAGEAFTSASSYSKLKSNTEVNTKVVIRFLDTVQKFVNSTNTQWHPLQVGDVELTVLGQVGSRKVVDNWGNQLQDTELMINITADKTAPVVESVEAVGEKEIEIVFSKPIIYDKANYEILAGDGSKFKGSFRSGAKEGKKVKLSLDSADSLVGKTVILNVKNVKDNTINMNKLVGTESFNVTFGDKTFEGVKEVYSQGVQGDVAKIFVVYKEAVDSATATDLKNYRWTTNTAKVELGQEEFSGDTSMYSDSIVQITVSKDFYNKKFAGKLTDKPETTGVALVISKNVTDAAGNSKGDGFTHSAGIVNKTAPPKLITKKDGSVDAGAVTAYDKHTLKLTFDQPLLIRGGGTIDSSVFSVSTDGGSVWNTVDSASFDGENVIVLNLKQDKPMNTDLSGVQVRYGVVSGGVLGLPASDLRITNQLNADLLTFTRSAAAGEILDKVSPEYDVVVATDTAYNFSDAIYKYETGKHFIYLTFTENVKNQLKFEAFTVRGADSEVYNVKDVTTTANEIKVEFTLSDSQKANFADRIKQSLDETGVMVGTKKYVQYLSVELNGNHNVIDLVGNKIEKRNVEVYHTEDEVILLTNADFANLDKLVKEVEAFIDLYDADTAPTGAGNLDSHYAKYGKLYVNKADGKYTAMTVALSDAQNALTDKKEMKEKAEVLQAKFDDVKTISKIIAPELTDTIKFMRSQEQVDYTNVKVEGVVAGEKLYVMDKNDNSAGDFNLTVGQELTAGAGLAVLPATGETKVTNAYFAVIKTDADDKVVSFKRFVAVTDLVNKKGEYAPEPTTINVAVPGSGQNPVGLPIDLKAVKAKVLTGYVVDNNDKIKFEVVNGPVEKLVYTTKVLAGSPLKAEQIVENVDFVTKDDIQLNGTGTFNIIVTSTKADETNGNYLPKVYEVTITVTE